MYTAVVLPCMKCEVGQLEQKVQEQNIKQSPIFAEQQNTSFACIFRKERLNELPGKFSEQLEQGWSVHSVHKCSSLDKGQFMRNDLGTSKSWKCVQGWKAPHEAIQKLSIDV
jgi:hypothetical protein